MTIKKRRVEGLVADSDHAIGTVSLGAKYAKILGYRARNWASSAKAGAGTDTTQKVKITDANDDIVFLDANDEDYATAEVTRRIALDDTATGLGVEPVDATGTAASAGAGMDIVAQGPVTVTILNGGTATDFFTMDLLVEVS